MGRRGRDKKKKKDRSGGAGVCVSERVRPRFPLTLSLCFPSSRLVSRPHAKGKGQACGQGEQGEERKTHGGRTLSSQLWGEQREKEQRPVPPMARTGRPPFPFLFPFHTQCGPLAKGKKKGKGKEMRAACSWSFVSSAPLFPSASLFVGISVGPKGYVGRSKGQKTMGGLRGGARKTHQRCPPPQKPPRTALVGEEWSGKRRPDHSSHCLSLVHPPPVFSPFFPLPCPPQETKRAGKGRGKDAHTNPTVLFPHTSQKDKEPCVGTVGFVWAAPLGPWTFSHTPQENERKSPWASGGTLFFQPFFLPFLASAHSVPKGKKGEGKKG